MINSARRSDPPPMRADPGPPPADGYAGRPAGAAPVLAGPLRSSITLPATAGQVAEARRFVAEFVDDPALAGDAVLCFPSWLLTRSSTATLASPAGDSPWPPSAAATAASASRSSMRVAAGSSGRRQGASTSG
jgi:hypothetical protein